MLQKISVAFMAFVFSLLAAIAYSQSPREELKQLTAQLQSNPSDTALREKIIKLAQALKPAPAIPQESERFDGRGEYAFKSAKTVADYLLAAQEFEKASNAAPWIASHYYNLGTAYEKAQRPNEAKRNFELYLLAAPDAQDAREVRRRISGLEFAIEKASSLEAQAAKKREQEEAILRSLDGALFVKEQTSSGSPFMKYTVEIRGRKVIYKSIYLVGGPVENVDGTCVLDGLQCEMDKKWAYTEPTRILLKISQDGREAVRTVFTNDVVSSEMVLQRAK